MNESLEELASLYVLDQLGDDERVAFEARLPGDPELARLVHDLGTAMARGVHALPSRNPPITTLEKIEQRIDALSAATALVRKQSGGFSWASCARWGIAAMIAVSLATLAVQSLKRSSAQPVIVLVEMNADKSTFAELPMRETAKDPDARFIQLASLAENYWGKSGGVPVKPDAAGNTHRGYALFDSNSQQGFIAIEQLPVLAPSQRYHLWVVEPVTGQIRDAGILPLAGLNRGLYSFALGAGTGQKNERPNIFVTVEENTTSPEPAQPHGKVVLGQPPI